MASRTQVAIRRRLLADEALRAMRGRAACRSESSSWWVSCEREYSWAETPVEARAASRDAMELCRGCPVRELCEVWAAAERYTGLAAGHAWLEGRIRDPRRPLGDQGGMARSPVVQLGWDDLRKLVQRLASG